ncbi:minor tail protein [Mycobacterium phage Pops]|uniref:Minor tail protein n=1 Tax=Mycobacterium phage Pops TaxID=1675554 RepID=A0A0K1LST7_9CAUD|nr:minor tail protein [Mycobacterium phage Pops]AKU45514.1 minor tail protein [Mycobacterium phage Pops]
MSAPTRVLDRGGEAHRIVTAEQGVTIHTDNGTTIDQFTPRQYTSCTWGLRLRDAGTADIVIPPTADYDRLRDIEPWAHSVTIWDVDSGTTLWTGPIHKARASRKGMTISAKDHSAYLSRTRNPITKRWDAADPATVAGELWAAMVEAQGINTRPIVRVDPEGDRYDFQVIADEQMLDQTLSDMNSQGLRWTVVAGTPIIGPVSTKALALLGEHDFLGDGIEFVRDGSQTYNDVLVRAADSNTARARVDYHGKNLQTIVNLDSMFGVSNVNRAARQYVNHTGKPHTRLELTGGTELHPNAPVSMDDLMPSARFIIEARGVRQLFELTSVDVERRQGAVSVRVTMGTVEDDIELLDATNGKQQNMTLGGQRL